MREREKKRERKKEREREREREREKQKGLKCFQLYGIDLESLFIPLAIHLVV